MSLRRNWWRVDEGRRLGTHHPFPVRYRLATGRPFSDVERLLLAAIDEGHTDLEQLKEVFRLHQRVIIEALVTLIQCGWVAQVKNGFGLTEQGLLGLDNKIDPPVRLLDDARAANLVQDRVKGVIAPARAIDVLSGEQARRRGMQETAIRLPLPESIPSLDRLRLHNHLPRTTGAWLDEIIAVEPLASDDWARAIVDLKSGQIHGLPLDMQDALSSMILEAVERAGHKLARVTSAKGRGASAKEDDEAEVAPMRTISLAYDDIVIGASHLDVLRTALRDVKGSLVVVAGDVRVETLRALSQQFEDALNRDVHIDLLWSGPPLSREVVDGLRAIRARTELGYLRWNQDPLPRVPIGLLLWDTTDQHHAVIGSATWLGRATGPELPPISVRIKDPALFSAVALVPSMLFTRGENPEPEAAARQWKRLSAEAERRAASTDAVPPPRGGIPTGVRVLHGPEISAELRRLIMDATARLFVATSIPDDDELRFLADRNQLANNDNNFTGLVMLSRLPDIKPPLYGWREAPQIQASVAISDGKVLIAGPSSEDAPGFGTDRVGLLLDGVQVADQLWNWFCRALVGR